MPSVFRAIAVYLLGCAICLHGASRSSGQSPEDNPNAIGNVIQGNIEIDGSGAPKERLEVVVQTATGRGSTRVYTDATGRFLVRGLFPGSYVLSVRAPQFVDYEDGSAEVLISGGLNTFSTYAVTIVLRRKVAGPTYAIRGRSIDAKETDRNVPGPARKLYKRGVAHAAKGERNEAVACFRDAVQIAPDYLFALNDMGVQLTRLGRYDEAIEVLNRAIAAAPSSFPPHINLAIAYLSKKDYAEARRTGQRASDVDPSSPEAHFILGRAARGLGDRETALNAYHRAFQEGGLDMVIVQIEIGQLYEEDGQRDAAIRAYETFLSLVSKGKEAEYARERIRALTGPT